MLKFLRKFLEAVFLIITTTSLCRPPNLIFESHRGPLFLAVLRFSLLFLKLVDRFHLPLQTGQPFELEIAQFDHVAL